MAASSAPRRRSEQRPVASRFIAWMRRLGSALARPFFALLLAIIAGGIVVIVTTPGTPVERLNAVSAAYTSLVQGSIGTPQSLSFTLVRVGPLILTGLSVAIAFRAGLFNIGAEGQLAVGATTAAIIAFKMPFLPAILLIPLMLIASMIAGAIWGGIVGLLKAWRGAHEVVTTIMLNWIAFYFTDYLIDGPLKAPNQADQTPSLPPNATIPSIVNVYNQTLGTFLPKVASPLAYPADMTLLLALLALVVYWFITTRTTLGYEIRVIGQNQKAAKYAGIPVKRNIFLVMAISGAFSGLAGAIHLMGQFPYQLIATTFSIDPTGFDAIGVALLGRTTAVGVLISAILFGGLRQGGTFMQINANIPGDLVYILQALVLFSIASEFLPAAQRVWTRWSRRSRRPALVPAIMGASVVPLSETGLAENGQNGQAGTNEQQDADATLISGEEE